MDAPPPEPWTYAARAAYFGDRVCRFCDHHNPAAAKFCNDCGSPLHLRRCNRCDAVNDQAATHCYHCGAECPALSTISGSTPGLPAANPRHACVTLGDVGVAANVPQPALRAGSRLFGPSPFLLSAIATTLIAAAYIAYRINAAAPDAIAVASQLIGAGDHNAPMAMSAVPMTVEAKPVEPETTTAIEAPIPNTKPEASKRATPRQRPVTVPATKRVNARQRPVSELQASVRTTPHVARSAAAAPGGTPVGQTRKAPERDPWQAMRVSLARCGGDLIGRMVCDQRVRRRFCEGHWGEAPECAKGIANDRGQ